MAEIMEGNHAIGWGALDAGCEAYCSYPITPQNEIVEFFAKELPSKGKYFMQSTSELESMFLSMGFAVAGARTMTSTASPGWGLCQEGLSHFVAAEIPLVFALLMRGGPGGGTTRHSQMDYTSAVHPGGHGGYKNIVLAPFSCQECYDLVQIAFRLSEEYRNPVIVLAEPNVSRVLEFVERKPSLIDANFEREWALKGKTQHSDGKARLCTSGHGITLTKEYPTYFNYLNHLNEKFMLMKESEVRYAEYETDDAEVVIIAYGYTARVSLEVIKRARKAGLKVGLIRPITLWPFPNDPVKRKADEGSKILVVEDSLGDVSGLADDVKRVVSGKSEVHLVTALDRHDTNEGGSIFPGKVFEKLQNILSN